MSKARGTKKRQPPELYDDAVLKEVKQLFGKVRRYSAPPGVEWCLPDPAVTLCQPPWCHPPLQALKISLNKVKNLLSDKDLSVWHQHTCSTNRAGTITSHLRETANAELCTQAWAKFYEILGSFPLIPEVAQQNGELNSVHLCEAPGAFISAFNHFLQTTGLFCDWTWVANTLNPYHEANGRSRTVADDRLIAHTLPWWFFGSDNTGDIMLQKHALELQKFVQNMRHVDVVTADGSFDCQDDPAEQERSVAPLQYCETVCALLLLNPGGSFVLKMFTLFEHSSVCLLYLLVCCFGSVSVFKPATSKSGNSEVYVVCLNFKSKDGIRPLLSKLIRNYGSDLGSTTSLFPKRSIPDSFLQRHEEICWFFHELQINTIQENMQLFGRMTSERRRHLDQLRECAAWFYTQRFQVQPLARKHWVCRGASLTWGKPCLRKQMGSFNQRKEMQFKDWRQRLTHGPYQAWIQKHFQVEEGHQLVLSGPVAEWNLNTWFSQVGAALPKVCSSTFCDPDLLDLFNKALEERMLVLKEPPMSMKNIAVCRLCSIRSSSPASILQEICNRSNTASCMVLVGDPSWQDGPTLGPQLQFCLGSSCSDMRLSTLHDGDPLIQQHLLSSVSAALCELSEGSSLVVPLLSALSRFTASLVLTLHLCFRSITFRHPACGPPVVLVCMGFSSVPQINTVLRDVLDNMKTLKPDQQLLQFAPMEELIRGSLPHFLYHLNNTVLRQQLHLLLLQEHTTPPDVPH